MSKSDILAELPRLKAAELGEIQAKLDEVAGESWLDGGELSEDDKTALNVALADYQKHPDAGGSWDDVKARIKGKLRP